MNSTFKILYRFLVIGIFVLISSCISEKNTPKIDPLLIDAKDSISHNIILADIWLNKLQKENIFNGAVLIIKNGDVVLKNSYGYTDFTKKIKLSNQSSFRLGSVSKQFTAAGILLLKQQGKLDFNDPITKFLPTLNYSNVTIRNLLNHTSGVPDIYMSFERKYKSEIGDYLSISKMVDLLSKENKPLKSTPNEVYTYNNTGYVLLAAIIESISNQSFENFMQQEIFQKLQLKNTRVWNLASKDATFENKTKSFIYLFGQTSELKPSFLDGVAGDGSVFSSIDDFVIWNKFWNQNNLISTEVLKEAFKKPILNNGKESDYGFGWVNLENDAMWHNGSWLGARTIIIRNSRLKNCLVILDNSSSKAIDNMVKELVKVLK